MMVFQKNRNIKAGIVELPVKIAHLAGGVLGENIQYNYNSRFILNYLRFQFIKFVGIHFEKNPVCRNNFYLYTLIDNFM